MHSISNPPILRLPREILDEVVRYLGSKSMLRFCRAIPQLNEYAEVLFDAATALKNTTYSISLFWPTFALWSSCSDQIFRNDVALTRLGALIQRFNGTTSIDGGTFPGHRISQLCSITSKNISLYTRFLKDKNEVRLWADQVVLHKKVVVCLELYHVYLSNLSLSEITDSVVDLNPIELVCEANEVILSSLEVCTRLRKLQLVKYDVKAETRLRNPPLSAILPRLQNLREFELKCGKKEVFLDIAMVLPITKIWKVRFEFFDERKRIYNYAIRRPTYLGDEEKDLAGLLVKAGFVYKPVSWERSLDEDEMEKWKPIGGFWYRTCQ
ncbi:hypothetical protein BCR33DRAFT_862295 [Rhizoclosmatium globosum]|uniref:F-box domain-containing protein n=1 Tax=Rhizoclosmatium globosum TaxID=329046 RepID=A0A1Y2AEL7_9FUNG|nr:hypothetical protein BCR33DRAFT_862295 [Rhizoclosmatium globosum]|eukprot:ORY21033.1 hypothetical protein BCR33DRAFT_862295 [Rhizoclosmatium globosum]